MPLDDDLPAVFVTHAAGVLGDTGFGLSGPQIIKLTAAYAADWDARLPHPSYPFSRMGTNKSTALFENLMAFPPRKRYRIIRDLCDHKTIQAQNKKAADQLKIQLLAKYGHLSDATGVGELSRSLIEETRHWLDHYPDSLALYSGAIEKYQHGVFTRNVLDDLRLALEKLLQTLLGNGRSLENQVRTLGGFIKDHGGSPELANMFVKLIDYYSQYQNTYVKHDDAVLDEEAEFVLEITSAFMKHFVRLHRRQGR